MERVKLDVYENLFALAQLLPVFRGIICRATYCCCAYRFFYDWCIFFGTNGENRIYPAEPTKALLKWMEHVTRKKTCALKKLKRRRDHTYFPPMESYVQYYSRSSNLLSPTTTEVTVSYEAIVCQLLVQQ